MYLSPHTYYNYGITITVLLFKNKQHRQIKIQLSMVDLTNQRKQWVQSQQWTTHIESLSSVSATGNAPSCENRYNCPY